MPARSTNPFTSVALLLLLACAGCPPPGGFGAFQGDDGGDGGGPDGGDGGGHCPVGCDTCDPQGACSDCVAGFTTCRGGVVYSCDLDGTLGAAIKQCDAVAGERCIEGHCLSACDAAAGSRSYIGCDYWPTTTLTGQLDDLFDFAVAVANPLTVDGVVQSVPAMVTVTRGGQTIATKPVAPGAVEAIILPWVASVSQNLMSETSALVADGAYHLTSSVPVTVSQFSPLQFEKPLTPACTDLSQTNNMCHSYSNDASILLPAPALGREYIAIARQTIALNGKALPGFFTVVGTEDNTSVTVTYSAHTEGGMGVTAANAGAQETYLLDAGTVLQVVSKKATTPCAKMSSDPSGEYCDLGPSYDLTGTHISADKPIAVFGGHSCSFVPYNKWACDHLEEQLVPLDTWGRKVIVVQTEPQIGGEPNVWRVVSGSAGNRITFDPPVANPVSLDEGEFVEFVAEGGFAASGTGRLAVAQYMVGENYLAALGLSTTVGDPSLGLGVPVEQYRDDYDFLTPTTYTKSYVNVIAPQGASLSLDGRAVTRNPTAIGNTGYGYLRILVAPGAHHITGSAPFGITVSGVADYTSYLYVGGQKLDALAP